MVYSSTYPTSSANSWTGPEPSCTSNPSGCAGSLDIPSIQGTTMHELKPSEIDVHPSPHNSVTSSNSIPTAYRIFSAAHSHTTTTDDSTGSDDARDAMEGTCQFRISRNLSGQAGDVIYERSVNVATLRQHSRRLLEDSHRQLINDEEYLVIVADRSMDTVCIKRLLDHVCHQPHDKVDGENLNLDEFFHLCVTLWRYRCRVDCWSPIADRIRREYLETDKWQSNIESLPKWLFIALVFDWPSVFEKASRKLLVDVPSTELIERSSYLPRELTSAILRGRHSYMEQTHQKILNICGQIGLSKPLRQLALLDTIKEVLSQEPSELSAIERPLPDDLYERVCPSQLLGQVSKAIGKISPPPEKVEGSTTEEVANVPAPSSLYSGKSLSGQRALTQNFSPLRDAEAGESIAEVLPDMLRAFNRKAKTILRRRPTVKTTDKSSIKQPVIETTPMTPDEIDAACNGFLDQIYDFLQNKLKPLDIDDFRYLREQTILSPPI